MSRTYKMNLYRHYFDLVASGDKSIEVRVNDASRKRLREGDLIRFTCQDKELLTRITRLTHYADFDEMFRHEPVTSVNPKASKAEQLRGIREIYPPEREALGVVAIGIELVDP